MDSYGYLWVPMDGYGFLWISIVSDRVLHLVLYVYLTWSTYLSWSSCQNKTNSKLCKRLCLLNSRMNCQNAERIMCMQHCIQDKNIFFIEFPSICPICGVCLQNCELIVPPFCVPSPFLSASCSDLCCCLLVKQTKGGFLRYQKRFIK